MMANSQEETRRMFTKRLLATTGLATTGLATTGLAAGFSPAFSQDDDSETPPEIRADIGSIFPEIQAIADHCDYPLSFLHRDYASVEDYRKTAQDAARSLLHYSPPAVDLNPEVIDRWETDDFIRETVLINSAPWFRIPAYVLLPKNHQGNRPAIVDLHCHAGQFMFGKDKVMPMRNPHPALTRLKQMNYDGRSTSEELVKRGYVVISIDRFYFGGRRTQFADMTGLGQKLEAMTVDQVQEANRRAGRGEATLTKSLLWAGTTWQGIGCVDDMRAVDYLATRPEVDPKRIGCMGISMGGDRANYLCALDDRIQCGVSVGWMAALRLLIQSHVDTHSFSHFLPGLTRYMDLPDLLGAFAPKPLLVLQCRQDGLYTLESMEKACETIGKIYQKAGAPEQYRHKFYDLNHRFSAEMQEDAFQWFDERL